MSEATSKTHATPAPDIATLMQATDSSSLTETVMPREGGASSTPRLIVSIIGVSGILDRPPSRAMTAEYDLAFSRR